MISRRESGITLVTLVITILIILTLAGSIIVTIGRKTGIFEKFKNIASASSNEQENIQNQIDDLKNKKGDNAEGVIENEDEGTIELKFSNINYDSLKAKLDIVQVEGEISYIEYGIKRNEFDEDYQYIESADTEYIFSNLNIGEYYDIKCLVHIANDKIIETPEYTLQTECLIGTEVWNYTTADETLDEKLATRSAGLSVPTWVLLYDDSYNYYLVTGGYRTGSEVPTDTNENSNIVQRTILTGENVTNVHLDEYLHWFTTHQGEIGMQREGSIPVDKKNAYLCNGAIWSQYKGEKAEMAIGGCPVEMYMYALNRQREEEDKLVTTYDIVGTQVNIEKVVIEWNYSGIPDVDEQFGYAYSSGYVGRNSTERLQYIMGYRRTQNPALMLKIKGTTHTFLIGRTGRIYYEGISPTLRYCNVCTSSTNGTVFTTCVRYWDEATDYDYYRPVVIISKDKYILEKTDDGILELQDR